MKILDEIGEREKLLMELPIHLVPVLCEVVVQYHSYFISPKELKRLIETLLPLKLKSRKDKVYTFPDAQSKTATVTTTTTTTATANYLFQALGSSGICVFVNHMDCRLEMLCRVGNIWIYSHYSSFLEANTGTHVVGCDLLRVLLKSQKVLDVVSNINFYGLIHALKKASNLTGERFIKYNASEELEGRYNIFTNFRHKIATIFGDCNSPATIVQEQLPLLLSDFKSLIEHPITMCSPKVASQSQFHLRSYMVKSSNASLHPQECDAKFVFVNTIYGELDTYMCYRDPNDDNKTITKVVQEWQGYQEGQDFYEKSKGHNYKQGLYLDDVRAWTLQNM